MKKNINTKFSNHVAVEGDDNILRIFCPVCGGFALRTEQCACCGGYRIDGKGACSHVLFICSYKPDSLSVDYSQPELEGKLQLVSEQYANALAGDAEARVTPEQLGLALGLDPSSAVVMAVKRFELDDSHDADQETGTIVTYVVGIRFPAASEKLNELQRKSS